MGIIKISKEDLFGIFYVRKSNGLKWDSYYETIGALRTLFQKHEFDEVVSGFYLNICGNFDSVRISYFVKEANSKEAISIFKQFFRENRISEIRDSDSPRKTIVAEKYGGEELEEEFRTFLVLETQIGLDLIQSDFLQARILFVTYCFQVRKAWLSIHEHFRPSFIRYSSTYASLPREDQERFLRDMQERLDWTHLMVNFVLGCDFQVAPDGRALSILEINEILKRENLGFEIPLDWKP